MKPKLVLLMVLFPLVVFTACKNKAVDVSSFEIVDENVQPELNGATISGTINSSKEIVNLKIHIGLQETLSDASVREMDLEGSEFSVAIEDLSPGTMYYYCYGAYFETTKCYLTETRSFSTLKGTPTVKTVEVQPNLNEIYEVKCKVISDAGAPVTERGVYWNTSGTPTQADHVVKHEQSGMGDYTCQIRDLSPNTTYYVRAYAKNSQGIGLGEVLHFTTTAESSLPVVQTTSVSGITSTTAVCGGIVTSEGNAQVTRRGVCWSTSTGPTISNNHADSGTGLGEFSANMTGLTPNTTYYVRAYAKNAQGTVYGNEVSFKTLGLVNNLPTVVTDDVTGITQVSASCGGKVTDEGGAAVTARGVCWGENENPTVNDAHTTNGSGLGSFISSITGLTGGRTYYVRAYATNNIGTSYGAQKRFETPPYAPEVPTGAINALFSVSSTKQVWFSCGSLQFQASTATWRFAETQEAYIGNANANISANYNGWIDMFGWGTSNYNHGAVKYQPWSTSRNDSDYYAYGVASYHLYNQTGKADWGYNSIHNGGNQEHYGWRTLTNTEWSYLFGGRQTPSGMLFVKAAVNDVKGIILFPDDWNASVYQFEKINTINGPYDSNVISGNTWAMLQSHGAVFLPAGGSRSERQIDDAGMVGYYWSACSKNASNIAYFLQFSEGVVNPNQETGRSFGCLVRLVFDK